MQRSTTSYVKLPGNYPKLRCSGRNADLDGLLNDIWVSVTSGSEDYSFKVSPTPPFFGFSISDYIYGPRYLEIRSITVTPLPFTSVQIRQTTTT